MCETEETVASKLCYLDKKNFEGRISNQISIEIDTFREMFFSYGIERTTIR